MKAVRTVILVIALLLVGLFGVDYLMMRSVQKNYISQQAMADANLLVAGKNLPSFTNTSMEWQYLTISLIVKLGLVLILILVTATRMWVMQRNINKLTAAPRADPPAAPPL